MSRTNDTVGCGRSEARIVKAMSAVGIVYRDLQSSSEEVVLFGSRAAGVATPSSDWDILCVGSGVSRMTGGLDLVCLRRSELDSLQCPSAMGYCWRKRNRRGLGPDPTCNAGTGLN